MDLTNIAVIINAAMMICLIIGAYIAIRSGKHQQTGTIQAQAIDALKAELDAYYQNHKEALCIAVEHPDIPENKNHTLPTLVPWYKTIPTEHGPVIRFVRVEHK